MNSWRKSAKPEDYDETGGFLWDQLTGLFKNPAVGAVDRIDNCDGDQAAWMFAVPGVALFQDFDATDAGHPQPAHEFSATYSPGKSYRLTIGVIGGGGRMAEGVTLELAFYYRDPNGLPVVIQQETVTNTRERFPNNTHLVDSSLLLTKVRPEDPWAGRHIGVRMLSTVSPDAQGGYWDLDNLRLEEISSLSLTLSPGPSTSELRLSWASEQGLLYQVRRGAELGDWVNEGAPIPGTGEELSTLIDIRGHSHAYFSLVATPAIAP